MDIDKIVNDFQALLVPVPREQRDTRKNIPESPPLVPWNWVLTSLVELFQKYPSGLTKAVLLNELQQSWDLRYGTAWSAGEGVKASFSVRRILESREVDCTQVIDAEIVSVASLEGSKATWIAKLIDPMPSSTSTSTKASSPSIDWILHQKYYPFMANAKDTLKRTSSRGFTHTLARARSLGTYSGPPVLSEGRSLKLIGCRLYNQWRSDSQVISLLPNEDCVILLNSSREAAFWPELSSIQIKALPAPSSGPFLTALLPADSPKYSFSAYIRHIPSVFIPKAETSGYVRLKPSPSQADKSDSAAFVDLFLSSSRSDDAPSAVLRLHGSHRALSSCVLEGDYLVVHGCTLQAKQEGFAAKDVGGTPSSDGSPGLPVSLPVFAYETNTVLLTVPKNIVDAEETLEASHDALNFSKLSSSFTGLVKYIDYSFHGPKVSPHTLLPSSNKVTMIAYVQQIRKNEPTEIYRRHGIRLQDTQSQHTCDVTIWETLNTTSSMTSYLRPGHLVLIQRLATSVKHHSLPIVLGNIYELSRIINISLLEGLTTSYVDIAPSLDFAKVCSPPSLKECKPSLFYGPFIVHQASIVPEAMVVATSLHHLVCKRSVGHDNGMGVITCSFCGDNVDVATACVLQFDMKWVLQAVCASKNTMSIVVTAKPELSETLLKSSAKNFALLSESDRDMLMIHRANYPLIGTACLSRTLDGSLSLDQFVVAQK